MLAFFWFPSSAQNEDFRCSEGTFSVFFVFFVDFVIWGVWGGKKGGEILQKGKTKHSLLD